MLQMSNYFLKKDLLFKSIMIFGKTAIILLVLLIMVCPMGNVLLICHVAIVTNKSFEFFCIF